MSEDPENDLARQPPNFAAVTDSEPHRIGEAERADDWDDHQIMEDDWEEHCIDCGVDTFEIGEYYMVYDPVWRAAGMEPDGGMLCLGCLSDRLGRRLYLDDFNPLPMNRRRCTARAILHAVRTGPGPIHPASFRAREHTSERAGSRRPPVRVRMGEDRVKIVDPILTLHPIDIT